MDSDTIKNARKSKGLTQEQTAHLLQITLRSYQHIEKCEHLPNVVVALKLCRLFDIDPYDTFLKTTV